MNLKKNIIIKNYLYNLLYQILLVIAPLVTAPYISRVLHVEGVGIYSYTYTIASAFALFAALGVNSYGQREIAYHQDDIYERSIIFWELLFFRIISTGFVVFLYLCFALHYEEYTIYLLQQSFIVIGTMFDISWFFQGIENFRIIAIRNIAIKLVTVALIFILIHNQNDLGMYILINSLSVFFSYALFFPYLRKSVVFIPIKELNIRRHIKGNIEFFIPLIATQLYSQLDKIMLGAITKSSIENGYYEQARKIVNIVVMVLTSINTVMYPRVANLYIKQEIGKIKKFYDDSFHIILMLLLPIIVGLFIASDNLVVWFFGIEYQKVSILLKLSGFLLIFMSVGNFVGMQYLAPTGKQNKMTGIYLVAAAINIILNFVLIKQYMSLGAIIASIVAEAFSCFAQVLLLKKSKYNFRMLNKTWKYLASSIIMGICLVCLNDFLQSPGIFETLFDIICGVIIYFTGLILLREEKICKLVKKKND